MAITFKVADRKSPPLEAFEADLERIASAQSPVARDLIINAMNARSQLLGAHATSHVLPKDIAHLAYTSHPLPSIFQKLRSLEIGWDGRQSPPPSQQLIRTAETFWRIFKDRFPQAVEPVVKPGPDGLVEFTWMTDSKRLIIGLYDRETAVSCDWYLELGSSICGGGELDYFDARALIVEVFVYLYF